MLLIDPSAALVIWLHRAVWPLKQPSTMFWPVSEAIASLRSIE